MTLENHGRYAYRSILDRPDYSWPGRQTARGLRRPQHRGVPLRPRQGRGHRPAGPGAEPQRLLLAGLRKPRGDLASPGASSTSSGSPPRAQMNTAIYDLCPDIPEALRRRGRRDPRPRRHQQRRAGRARRGRGAGPHRRRDPHHRAARGGRRPAGWMSPWLSNSAVTVDLLQEAGYRYFMDWTCDDQPIWMKTRGGRLLSMPYPIECNDTRGVVLVRVHLGRVHGHADRRLRRDAAPERGAAARLPRSPCTRSWSAARTGSGSSAGCSSI